MKKTIASLFMAFVITGLVLDAQGTLIPAPDRRPGEGAGPFPTLTIRNVTVIDGTGAPPFGPANVMVENNRIARIVNAGTPGVPSREAAPAPAPTIIAAQRTRSSRPASSTISGRARAGAAASSTHRNRRASGCNGARPMAWTG